jgi:undecaprenyl-diphosphatase
LVAAALGVAGLRWAAWHALRLTVAAVGLAPAMRDSRVWQRSHPLRARIVARFPRLYGAVRARLTPRVFTGLPLTLLVAAALYLVALLDGLVEDVLQQETIVRVDEAVNRAFGAVRTKALLELFLWITPLGAGPALCAVAITATGFLWAHLRRAFIVPLWVAFLGAQATTYIGKYAVGRVRPEFLPDITALTPSFPSGHATAATAVYGFLAYAIARDVPGLRMRFEVAFWTVILVLLVALSRIVLRVHYLSDVLSGLLVGGFWLIVAFALSEWTRAKGYSGR